MAAGTETKTGTGTKTEVNPMEIVARLLEQNNELLREVRDLRANGAKAVGTNGRGGRHAPIHVQDTKTGKVYRTQAEAGMRVAPEFGLKVHNFVWYELVKGTKNSPAKCPNRFKVLDEKEYQNLLAKQNAKVEQKVEQKSVQPQGQVKK